MLCGGEAVCVDKYPAIWRNFKIREGKESCFGESPDDQSNRGSASPSSMSASPLCTVQYSSLPYLRSNIITISSLLSPAKVMIWSMIQYSMNTPYKHTSSADTIGNLYQSTPSVSPSSSSPSSASDTFSPKSFSRCLYFSHLSSKSPNTINRSSSSL